MLVVATLLWAAPADDAVSCGAACVYLFAREVGKPIALDDVKKLLPDAPGGHSFSDLEQAADAGGVAVSIANVAGKKLPTCAFVAHFSANGDNPVGHFVFFRPLEPTGHQFQMIAPPFDPEVVAAAELLSRSDFSGWIMTPAQIAPTHIAGIVFLAAALLMIVVRPIRRIFRYNGV